MNSYVKLKWFILPLAVIIGVCLEMSLTQAASFQNLQDVQDAAWAEYCKKGDTSNGILEKDLKIDGAVDINGGVKVIIDNWKKRGIPKDDKELLVYAAPDAKEAVGKIYPDTIMSVISTEGEWVRIHSGYLQGYVRKDRILQGNDAKKRAAVVCPRQVMSDYKDTRIMSQPDRKSNVLQYMEQRQVYPVLGMEDGWAEIKVDSGLKGYIFSQDVKEVRSIHLGRTIRNAENPQQPFFAKRLSTKDRNMLAALIYCEAQGEVFEGQVAIVTVVLNRLYSDQFPNTLSEVIYQKNQFEPVARGAYDAVLGNIGVVDGSCYEAVDTAVQGSNTVGNALYFNVDGYGKVIGNHGFY